MAPLASGVRRDAHHARAGGCVAPCVWVHPPGFADVDASAVVAGEAGLDDLVEAGGRCGALGDLLVLAGGPLPAGRVAVRGRGSVVGIGPP